MARSLFQRPRGTGFQGAFDAFEDDGESFPRRRAIEVSQPRRWPPIVRLIGFLFAVAFGMIAATMLWLIVGGLFTGSP